MNKPAALFLLLLIACSPPPAPAEAAPEAAPAGSVRLERLWVVEGLANPESVALSDDGSFLYVSNVAGEGEAKDGNGFIARVGRDGRMLERDWVTGLNGPKGLALHAGKLYAADIDALDVIDVGARSVTRVPAPGAKFLNDVAIAPDGRVLVTDSETGRIYVLHGERLEVWLEGPFLASVNGLLPESERLFVTTMQGRLLAVDYATRAIETRAQGLGDADGVVRLGSDLLISEWPGLLHVVHPDGTHETISDTRAQHIFMNDVLLASDTLYAPNWEPSTLTAFRLVH